MNLFIVQPKLATYRIPIYSDLGRKFDAVTVFHEGSLDGMDSSIEHCESRLLKRVTFIKGYYQKGLIASMIRKKPDNIFFYADLNNITLWISLLLAKILGIRLYLHGQGFFKKTRISLADKILWMFAIKLSTKFIAYNQLVSDEMMATLPSLKKKIRFCSNTLQDNELLTYSPAYNPNNGILFVGRIRDDVNLNLLIDAVANINFNSKVNEKIKLHIIGGGAALNEMKAKYINQDNITWHGKIYSNAEIAEIAQNCSIGVYPGDGGLSVVHYMSLGLFPVVHDSWKLHMGPEPWYTTSISDNYFFERNSQKSLENVIANLFANDNRSYLVTLRKQSRQKFEALSQPSYSEQIFKIIMED